MQIYINKVRIKLCFLFFYSNVLTPRNEIENMPILHKFLNFERIVHVVKLKSKKI